MGFIEEIERRRQLQAHQEASSQANIRSKPQEIQRSGFEIDRDFLEDSQIILNILHRLYELGYKDYFRGVAEVSGFDFTKIFYVKHGLSVVYDYNRELGRLPDIEREWFHGQEKLSDATSHLGWWGSRFDFDRFAGNTVKYILFHFSLRESSGGWFFTHTNSNKMFFGDNEKPNNIIIPVGKGEFPTRLSGRKFTEPQGVGIGIRFLKYVREIKHRNRLAEFFNREHWCLVENWSNAVYIRINNPNDATITGSTQSQVSLQDIGLFDRTLEQAINNPLVCYSTREDRWTPPLTGGPGTPLDSGRGGA